MLGHVHSGAAILAPEGESLQESKNYEDDRSRDSDPIVAGKKPDRRRGSTHDEERRQKREFPAGEVANASKDERAEWTNREADRERREGLEKTRGRISAGKKLRRDNRGEAAEDVEVVPLYHRADGRCGDHFPDSANVSGCVSNRAGRRAGIGHDGCHCELSLGILALNWITVSSHGSDMSPWRTSHRAMIEMRAAGPPRCFLGSGRIREPPPGHTRL